MALAVDLAVAAGMTYPSTTNFNNFSVNKAMPSLVWWDRTSCDETRLPIDQIEFGSARYSLHKRLKGTFVPALTDSNQVEFFVAELSHSIVGCGNNRDEAYADWTKQVHFHLQTLIKMRPFEMDANQSALWKRMTCLINVEHYLANLPIAMLQTGTIHRARPYPQRIEWEDGTREDIELDKMPDDFITYKFGQPFEALVFRSPQDYKIIKVDYVKKLRSRQVTPSDIQKLWDSTCTTSELPVTE